jgi:two-component system response regulator YesN
MYNVIIVDDEPFVLNGLIHFIDWGSLECNILCYAEDGIEAMAKIQSSPPDIVITDIKMPGIDGIGLTKYLYENYPEVKVIILTGYADFNYAKEAIKYNVVDFVLKPAFTEKIIEAVNKAKETIIEQKEIKIRLDRQENKINDLSLEVREKYVYDLISGVMIDTEEILQKAEQLNLVIENYYVLLFQINKKAADIKQKEQSHFNHSIKNYISLSFKAYNHYSFFFNRQTLCSVVSFGTDAGLEQIQTLVMLCEKMLQTVRNNSQFEISVGISSMHKCMHEMSFAYEEANRFLSDSFFQESNLSIFSNYVKNQSPSERKVINSYLDRIMDFIASGKSADAVSSMNELLKGKIIPRPSLDQAKGIGISLCYLCSHLLGNHSLRLLDILDNGEYSYKHIAECKSSSSMSTILAGLIHSVSDCLFSSNKVNSGVVNMVMEYIHKNYNHDITLNLIANYVHLNSSYLSRVFCKMTGKTIVEVVNGARIEKAKEMLAKNEIKISEIASLVGIEDANYFSQLFRKRTGMTPSEYKRAIGFK